MKFRKRPVVVEAVRWTGSNVDEAAAFFGTPPAIVAACISSVLGEYRLPIVTLEGVVTASPGDWIIRGVKGEYYPCKPDVFERTYEVADEATPATPWNSPGVVMAPARVEVRTVDDRHTDAGWLRDEHASDDLNLPSVDGEVMSRSVREFVLGCRLLLKFEQEKISPDNALIAVLCDAVRLTREMERMAKTPIEVRTSGRDSGRNVETALAFLLTRTGSRTNARWDQHLRYEFGDGLANQMIAALKKLSGLE